MLWKLSEIRGYGISASDGELGRAHDFYFDDRFWHIRYLVIDTGTWLPGRRVLISPAAIGPVTPGSDWLNVALTREQIRNSPDIDTDKPVSRQHEAELTRYYDWPVYWAPGPLFGAPALAGHALPSVSTETPEDTARSNDAAQDPNLRSANEVTGYHIEAADGRIGHVEDFIVDDDNWIVRYFVIDTRNWLPGRKVLTWPQLMTSVSWADRKVHVALDRETIRTSPAYQPSRPVARDYELLLYEHYGQQGYWLDAPGIGVGGDRGSP